MNADKPLFASKHFRIEWLAEGVYAAIHSAGGTAIGNAGIIDLGDRTLVFDALFTPQAAEDLRAAAEALTGRPVSAVIDSHWHSDHIWGNQAFDKATDIISTEETRRLILATRGDSDFDATMANAETDLAVARARLEAAKDKRQRYECALWLDQYQGLVGARPILKVRAPNLAFTGRMAFHGAQRCAELIAFDGGHTESDAVLWLPQERIVFTSDLLFVGHHPYLGGGTPEGLLRALDAVSALAPGLLVPGHGTVGTTKSLRAMRQYVIALDDMARRMVEAGEAEQAIDAIAIPEPHDAWLISSFFASNMRCLYRRHLRSGEIASLRSQ
jgi:glyoxylase-like metal-dependent hydrolase (beta-lactamase superfamily II)